MEESKEANTASGQATHQISGGILDKGHTVSRKLNSNGMVDKMQTLHNLKTVIFVHLVMHCVGRSCSGWLFRCLMVKTCIVYLGYEMSYLVLKKLGREMLEIFYLVGVRGSTYMKFLGWLDKIYWQAEVAGRFLRLSTLSTRGA